MKLAHSFKFCLLASPPYECVVDILVSTANRSQIDGSFWSFHLDFGMKFLKSWYLQDDEVNQLSPSVSIFTFSKISFRIFKLFWWYDGKILIFLQCAPHRIGSCWKALWKKPMAANVEVLERFHEMSEDEWNEKFSISLLVWVPLWWHFIASNLLNTYNLLFNSVDL